MTTGEKIQQLRKKNGWTQEELAEKLDISRQALSKWELGTSIPDTKNIVKLAKLFSVTTDYLLDDAAEALDPDHRLDEYLKHQRLTGRARHLIDTKGYMAAYLLAIGSFLGLIAAVLIGWTYVSTLSHIAPLSELPGQAWILPAFAAVIIIGSLCRTLFYLVLAHKLKKIIKKAA